MLARAGISREEGLKALLPLIKGTLNNMEALGVPRSLTGPISRGDSATIDAHISNMEEVYPEIIPLYKRVGAYTVGVAEEKGSLNRQQAVELRKILEV
jgi:predicted short-subunit dehydrogenase-like oxidoreductase (DUF2520 family)